MIIVVAAAAAGFVFLPCSTICVAKGNDSRRPLSLVYVDASDMLAAALASPVRTT